MNVSRGIIGALCDKLYRNIELHIIAVCNAPHNAFLPSMLL
jgi:hypothetical protein